MTRKRKILIGLCIFAGIVVIGIVGLFVLGGGPDLLKANLELDQAVKDYRASGLPWTATELEKEPYESPGNAAPLIIKAGMLLESKNFTKVEKKALESSTNARWSELARLLKPFDICLDLSVQASKKPFLRWEDYDQDIEVLFPYLRTAKVQCELLGLRAELLAHTGRPGLAVQDLVAESRLIHLLSGPGPALLHASASSLFTLLSLDINRIAAESNFEHPKENLGSVLNSVNADWYQISCEPFAAYDFVASSRNVKAEGVAEILNSNPKPKNRTGLPQDFFSKARLTRHLQTSLDIHKIVIAWKHDPKGDLRTLDQDIAELQKQIENKEGTSYMVQFATFTVWKKTIENDLSEEARWATSTCFLYALTLKNQTGTWPKSLSEIPGTWIDPFDGKPLRVKSGKDSFRVYSVGPDGVDNGGIDQLETVKSDDQYDIVAGYPPIFRKVQQWSAR